MSLKIHAKTKIYESMCMDNSFSYTFKMKFKWWQCIRKININIKSLLILIQGKQLGFSLSAIWQIHFFFGGYLCNVTSFISLDHLIKIYILRYRTHTNNQNFVVNIYIISNFKACTYDCNIKYFFILHFQTKSYSLKRILNVYRVNYLRMLMACDLPFQHDSRSQ